MFLKPSFFGVICVTIVFEQRVYSETRKVLHNSLSIVLMVMMINVNNSRAVLLIESISSPAGAALKFSSNEKYVIHTGDEDAAQLFTASRESTPLVTLSRIICALQLTQIPLNPLHDWVFGSQANQCDFQLAKDKRIEVSERYFRIHYN